MIPELLHDVFLLSLAPVIYAYYLTAKRKKNIKRDVLFRIRSLAPIKSDVIVHSSSLGETKNALMFSEELKRRLPDKRIVNTVFTETALKTFQETFPIPPPLFLVHKLLVNTKTLVFFESDFWPSYIFSVKNKKGKVLIVSGKISKRSAELWRRIPTLKKAAEKVDHVFAKDEENKTRFQQAGFRNVSVSDDMKNIIFLKQGEEKLKLNVQKRIVFGISTRGSYEIEFLIRGCASSTLALIIAPRHDFQEAEKVLSKHVPYVKLKDIMERNDARINNKEKGIEQYKAQIEENIRKGKVILVDSYGYTEDFLKISDVCFVGGTIAPIGGHNVLEPLSFKIPVIVGPNNWNVPRDLISEGIIQVVKSPEELNAYLNKGDLSQQQSRINEFIAKKKKRLECELERIISYIVSTIPPSSPG